MTWKVYLLKTVTGEVGPPLDVQSGSWSIELNKTEAGSVKARKAQLRRIPRRWWEPRTGSILMTYTDADGVERPIVAGPITGWPTETPETLDLEFAGIRSLLELRTIAQDMTLNGPSLGSIAWAIVDETCRIKPGGALPIIHGSPWEESGRQRTYYRWNLANNIVDKRLTELTEVINGPDIMFRPQWADEDHTRITWAMVHGSEADPRIPQTWTPVFDTTAARSDVQDLTVKSTATHLATRVWYTGAGEGEGTARVYAEDTTRIPDGVPFTEKVLSDSDQPNPDRLREKAEGALAASKRMLDQVTMSIRAGARRAPLGLWHVGDTCEVTLAGWVSIPDGSRLMRIIAASGDLSEKVTLDFQENTWD